jgi:protein-S-isoprenylcysteine O-methyltransferase Ste14
MLSIRILWGILCLCWVGAEVRLAREKKPDRAILVYAEQRSQRILWLAMTAGVISALIAKSLHALPIPVSYLPRQAMALTLFAFGLGLRYWAVACMSRFFTTDVTIQQGHELVFAGAYRIVRHPAYSGLLLALAGAGLAMGNVLALLLATLPAFLAIRFRIRIEEECLVRQFGARYHNYRKTTFMLFPWIY